ncbi:MULTISPECIES: DUF1054 family protein [Enterococcaceae]|uniref:DUF1054 family protein n=1 Tax=Enterococcaceae TaxID=81852 RepID=UPI0018F7CBC7|nr:MULTISPECIES: DUF1054 family protein [Enterococcaceae]MCI0131036.1 DUF1054 domain-containing protein [Vagococcus sp. CY53-2]UNM89390.1 DUF1054 domain-containing protein [Vagococcus sp. CY52-2]
MLMFNEACFEVFNIEGLDSRMIGIREKIQPVFQSIDEKLVEELEPLLGEKLPIHIAQHRRRTTNAPNFTWSAMGGNKRGYKKFPHFQLGITPEYVVIWLSFIDNPQNEVLMAQTCLDHLEWFESLPNDFVVNTDHTKNNYHALEKERVIKDLTRWRDVKKGEFQIGRVIQKNRFNTESTDVLFDDILQTYLSLIPIYQACFQLFN